MAENKTQRICTRVGEFLTSIENIHRREDGVTTLQIMKEVTELEPKMWGQVPYVSAVTITSMNSVEKEIYF